MGREPGGSSIGVETADVLGEDARLSAIGGIDVDPEPARRGAAASKSTSGQGTSRSASDRSASGQDPAVSVWDEQTVKAYEQAFEQAGCDELIWFPCSSDPEQVDLLARAGAR